MFGDYYLHLPEGKTIYLRYCTWSLQRFCSKFNVPFARLNDVLITGLTLNTFIRVTLCAAEYDYYRRGEKMEYTEMNVSDWIDEVGGISGKVFIELTEMLINAIAPAKIVDAANNEMEAEKKRLIAEAEALTMMEAAGEMNGIS